MTTTTEVCGRYEIEISGPDALTGNKFWVKVRSLKAKMGRTVNNFVSLVASAEEAAAKVAAFKAKKGL